MIDSTGQDGMISDRELAITRLLDAPRELVWKVWTEPEHVAQWWGPHGFTNTNHQYDFRPDGKWLLTMHGPNNANYSNESVFVEIVRPEKLVVDHTSPPKFRWIATFAEESGKTRVTFRMIFESAEECGKVKGIALEGNRQFFEKLSAYLKKPEVLSLISRA